MPKELTGRALDERVDEAAWRDQRVIGGVEDGDRRADVAPGKCCRVVRAFGIGRAEEGGVAEGEDAAVGGDEPVAASGR